MTFLKLTHRTRVKVEIKHPWNIFPLLFFHLSGWSTFFPSNFIRVSTVETNYHGISLYKGLFLKFYFIFGWAEKTSRRNLFAPVFIVVRRSMRNRWIRIILWYLVYDVVDYRFFFFLSFFFSNLDHEEENLIKFGGKFFSFFFSILFYSLVLSIKKDFFYRHKENFIRRITFVGKFIFHSKTRVSCNLSLASLICIHF